ncbi:MAG: FliM/FliN family flagellar motor switch protein, partial [Phycisphaeraceae bacterium]
PPRPPGYSLAPPLTDKTSVKPDIQTILKLRVPVIVRIGQRKMSLDDVLALGPGAIVELSKGADDQLDLLVNNKPAGTGAAVKVGENFGLRLTAIGSPRERIAALAPTTDDDA